MLRFDRERGPEHGRATVKDGFGPNGTSATPLEATSEQMERRKDSLPGLEVAIRERGGDGSPTLCLIELEVGLRLSKGIVLRH